MEAQAKAAPAIDIENMRGTRFLDLISPATLAMAHVAIIGTGAIGRQAAIQLASMGIGTLTLVDFDTVSEVNLGPQGWLPSEIGRVKVDALRHTIRAICPETNVLDFNEKFKPEHIAGVPYVLACVDSMEVRKEIAEAAGKDLLELRLLADARMNAEAMEIHCVTDEAGLKHYLENWYPSSEGNAEGCTAKSTIYCASLAASWLVASISKAMRRFPLPYTMAQSVLTMTAGLTWPEEPAPAEA